MKIDTMEFRKQLHILEKVILKAAKIPANALTAAENDFIEFIQSEIDQVLKKKKTKSKFVSTKVRFIDRGDPAVLYPESTEGRVPNLGYITGCGYQLMGFVDKLGEPLSGIIQNNGHNSYTKADSAVWQKV